MGQIPLPLSVSSELRMDRGITSGPEIEILILTSNHE